MELEAPVGIYEIPLKKVSLLIPGMSINVLTTRPVP
jgi:hypothetical protein